MTPLTHTAGGTLYRYCYEDGTPICEGDRLRIEQGGNFVGGGHYSHIFIGTVTTALSPGNCIYFKDAKWIHHKNISQRFGSSERPSQPYAQVAYDYTQRFFKLEGKVQKLTSA